MFRTLSVAFAVAVATAAQAQAQTTAPPAGQAPKLMAVTEGVFELRQGKSVDIGKTKLLLTFKPEQRPRDVERGQFAFLIAGRGNFLGVGNRMNLKDWFRNELKDYTTCYVDLVDVIAPKGAAATATLRLECF